MTLVVEDRGNGFFKQSNTGQPADGPGGVVEQTLKCDGQDYAYRSDIQYSNFPNVSMTRYVSCTKRSATTFEFTLRDESKRVLSLSTRTMSPDGTSFTEPRSGYTVEGPSRRSPSMEEQWWHPLQSLKSLNTTRLSANNPYFACVRPATAKPSHSRVGLQLRKCRPGALCWLLTSNMSPS